MGDFRRTKSNWMRPSLNPMGPNRGSSGTQSGSGRIRSPWDQDSAEVIDDFYRNLEAVNTEVTHPWDVTETDLEALERQKAAAAGYKFNSLFEAPQMSEERKRQLEEYKINPPFNCGYNEREETKRPPRRQDPHKNPKTKEPWAWGAEPGEPVHRKIFPKPSTALWEAPRGDQSGNQKKEMVSSGDPVLDSLRAQLFAHGASGIQGLSRKFRIMDDDGSGTLNLNELRKGLKESGLVELSERAIGHLFRYFDKDDTGTITYDEFLVGIRGVMNERRKKMVELAFRVLDTDASGVVDLNDVKTTYDVRSHPDVMAGRLTPEEALQDFLDTFRAAGKRGRRNQSVGITFEDFCDYYSNLSASIDSDDYFELMIRNAWHISGGSGWCENTTNRRLLVTHADGRQSVQEIQNDIGIRAKDTDKMMAKLSAQGIKDVKNINLTGIEDMKHQIENPEYRAALQKQLDEENRLQWLQEQQSALSSKAPAIDTRSSPRSAPVAPVNQRAVSGGEGQLSRGIADARIDGGNRGTMPVPSAMQTRPSTSGTNVAGGRAGGASSMSSLATFAAAGVAQGQQSNGLAGGSRGGIAPPVSLARIISGR